MEIRFYNGLCPQARAIREAVFVQEQGFLNEFDEIDDTALHMVIYDGETAVATGRVYQDAAGEYRIGRVAVVKEYRGKHMGNQVLCALEQKVAEMGAQSVSLSAQCAARGFYEKNGYTAAGEVYFDEHCPHVHMEKRIGQGMPSEFITPPNHVGFLAKKLFGEMGKILDGSVAYIEPNGGGPDQMHTHAHDHLFVVVKGEAEICLEDQKIHLKKDEAFLVKGCIPHSVWNCTDEITVMLGISVEQ